MSDRQERERAARVRQARQVIAGPDITPPDDPLGHGRGGLPASPALLYLIAVSVLVVLSALLWAIGGMSLAAPAVLVLALALIAAWFVL